MRSCPTFFHIMAEWSSEVSTVEENHKFYYITENLKPLNEISETS